MTEDVHEDIAVEIARELEREGTCVRLIESNPPQRVVDVYWAAKRAGRMIDQHVRISVTRLSERLSGDVAVVVILEPRSGAGMSGRLGSTSASSGTPGLPGAVPGDAQVPIAR